MKTFDQVLMFNSWRQKKKEKKIKIKNFLRSLKFIKNDRDFNLGPIIKIDQSFDLVKLNRKEVIWKRLDY